jgi:CheY-like chemotaxis protein
MPVAPQRGSQGEGNQDRDDQGAGLNGLSARRVLLVEDDYLIATDLQEELQQWGATVIGPVATLDEAMDLAKTEQQMDVALVDIDLHGEFSFHLADELIRRDIPVAFSTGFGQDVLPYRLRHVPLYAKPVSARTVAQGLAELLAEQQHREG